MFTHRRAYGDGLEQTLRFNSSPWTPDNFRRLTPRVSRAPILPDGRMGEMAMPIPPFGGMGGFGCPAGSRDRFFGTLKQVAKQVKFENCTSVAQAMESFRFWYNRVRPHQNLGGRTPGEAWSKIDPFTLPVRRSRPFQAWGGVLTGCVITHGRRC